LESTALINRDWKGKNLQLIQETSHHAEAKLVAQVQLAISADARASILAGIFAAAGSGCVVVLVTSAALQSNRVAIAATIGAATSFAIGAALCVWAAWPCDFRTPGNDPNKWYEDIDAGSPLEKAAGDQLQLFDSDIRENNDTLKKNAKRLQGGIVVGTITPLVGLLAALAAMYFKW
jgi:hypothetical protein